MPPELTGKTNESQSKRRPLGDASTFPQRGELWMRAVLGENFDRIEGKSIDEARSLTAREIEMYYFRKCTETFRGQKLPGLLNPHLIPDFGSPFAWKSAFNYAEMIEGDAEEHMNMVKRLNMSFTLTPSSSPSTSAPTSMGTTLPGFNRELSVGAKHGFGLDSFPSSPLPTTISTSSSSSSSSSQNDSVRRYGSIAMNRASLDMSAPPTSSSSSSSSSTFSSSSSSLEPPPHKYSSLSNPFVPDSWYFHYHTLCIPTHIQGHVDALPTPRHHDHSNHTSMTHSSRSGFSSLSPSPSFSSSTSSPFSSFSPAPPLPDPRPPLASAPCYSLRPPYTNSPTPHPSPYPHHRVEHPLHHFALRTCPHPYPPRAHLYECAKILFVVAHHHSDQLKYLPQLVDIIFIFLLHMSPANAYACVETIVRRTIKGVSQVSSSPLHRLHMILGAVTLLEGSSPDLSRHANDLNVSLPTIVNAWTSRLFVSYLPAHAVHRLFDYFLLETEYAMLTIAIALLSKHQDILLRSTSSYQFYHNLHTLLMLGTSCFLYVFIYIFFFIYITLLTSLCICSLYI